MAINIKHDDNHTVEILDKVTMTFMSLAVHRLNEALHAHVMADSSLR